ncbi:5'-nucleotidase [Lentibacillus sp. JNUCC-1]|uniref:bifunctional metallophosphatase/5'-nucleotidase n=1 Tax=Lentibacillus sp. JNUCC-1 TaxID=2654513 RepID=UPI0012E94ACB|nr:bifunctional UDP-sugar hydrolase/5'-nucleotidase [Lentibacillus sp. JNUCC-1]MUV39169.1 5'-nucleotidase [Lentibacillus sp. JNUCC-1]
MQETIHIYYTNDLHSYFEHWPQVVGFLKDKQMQDEVNGHTSLRVDIGDHVDRVHPIAEAFMGKANIELLNEADYDVVTLGNNEGITMAHEDLEDLYNEASFSVVCANLSSETDRTPSWLQSHVQIQSLHGLRIGFIGLTAPFNDFYELLDWHVESPYVTLDDHLHDMKQSCDVIVLLSHLGLSEDQEIARRFPEIDIIIGGHTHHLLKTGEYVGNTLITAAGKQCQYVGEVVLHWNNNIQRLVKKEAYAVDISHLAKDMPTSQKLQQLDEEADRILSVPVGYTSRTLKARWFNHTELMQALTDTLLNWTGADVAMLNAGLILDDIPAGEITYKRIHSVCPHPINPCVVKVTGAELLEIIRMAETKDFTEIKLKGFGFRGEVIGKMIYSGIRLETVKRSDGEEVIINATINGVSIQPDESYRLATADTFTFGRLLPEVAKSESKTFFLPEFLRDLLLKTVKNLKL